MRSHLRSRPPRSVAGPSLLLFAGLVGCQSSVASGLEETEANRIVVALDRVQIASTKESDPSAEGRFRITVADGDSAMAMQTLRAEELPRRRPASVLDATQKGALLTSPEAEHAQLAAGVAGELERSLETLDGVLTARVHLNLPAEPRLAADGPARKPSASVLLSHRGTSPPLAEAAVQRLVAGAVPSLEGSAVSVVMVPRGAPSRPDGEAGITKLGPFGVARSSLRAVQATFVAMLLAIAGLAGALAWNGARKGAARAKTP